MQAVLRAGSLLDEGRAFTLSDEGSGARGSSGRYLVIIIWHITVETHYLGISKYFGKLHFKGACYGKYT